MTQYFHVSCLVPAHALHETMRFLESKRAANMDVRTYIDAVAPPGAANERGPKSHEIVTQIIQQKGAANADELRAALVAAGFSVKTFNTAIHTALKNKLIRRGKGKGEYIK